MGILAIFNLKKDFIYLKNSGKLDEFKKFIENQIIYYVKKEMAGANKKAAVVAAVIGFIAKYITPVNPCIGSLFNVITPLLVQYLYDSLKAYVDGLTITQ